MIAGALFELVGKVGAVPPEHIGAGVVKVGVTFGVTSTERGGVGEDWRSGWGKDEDREVVVSNGRDRVRGIKGEVRERGGKGGEVQG